MVTNPQTSYQRQFAPLPPGSRPEHRLVPGRPQTDEELVSGHIGNNLKVNGIHQKSKVWPHINRSTEEYDDFLKRIQICRHPLYDLYFKCFDFDFNRAEGLLRDQRKTQYQLSYSPNQFVPRKVVCRFNLKEIQEYLGPVRDYETTCNTYYDRVREPPLFNQIWRDMRLQPRKSFDRPIIDFKGRKLGTTAYNVDYCEPALETSKAYTLKTGPIDKYSLRKI